MTEVADTTFKTTARQRKVQWFPRAEERRGEGVRSRPECVVLGVRDGVAPSGKPPVRIFLGTEPAQHRAERVFVWSIEQVRDPSRIYEVYLMCELSGFDRRKWKTGFTMYRFAIPELAGGQGRAIYNDVDQIYLSDPAELFDGDMDGHGYLSITRQETSVMLIDCGRMAQVWRLDDARRERKRFFRERAEAVEALWGPLAPEWNARDQQEYRPGQSKLLHFTTLHRQPWRPFPRQLRYQPHPLAELWLGMERAAEAAGFHLFTRSRPSRRYRELLAMYQQMHADGARDAGLAPGQTFAGTALARHVAPIAELVRASGARSLLDYGSGKGTAYRHLDEGEPRVKAMPEWGADLRVTCYDPAYPPFSEPPDGPFDGVICTDVLEHVPEEDLPWVLDELFGYARRFVYAAAACYPARKALPNGENAHCTVKSPEWWRERFEAAARRHPGVTWQLYAKQRSKFRRSRVYRAETAQAA